ncbi:hypothetical protein SUGI_0444210 [Cryptomeria japonica]|uniref:uncharacterized protein LOC131076669 n=1 Tax=Cryptomeria japonica TaxID=3369 RepID=UPI002408BCD0|nr:uncharacterized protein LOC131076669 [Cryptomeria japonica]GLJ23462.1 hypothetical protein SUGI_0444210 [Cryptomeria japonica]
MKMTYEKVDAECEDGPMSGGNLNSLWYGHRWAEGPCGLGLQVSQCRDNFTSSSAFRTDLDYRSLENPIHSFVSTNPVDFQGKCRFKLASQFREGVNMGDHMPPFRADQCEILHCSQIPLTDRGEEHFNYTLNSPGIPFPSTKCVLKDKGRANMLTSRMKEPLTSPQSRTNLSMHEFRFQTIMDEPRKRKYTDSSSLLVDKCTMTLNGFCSDYDGRCRETRRAREVDYENANLESTIHYQGSPSEGTSVQLCSGFDDRYDNMHRQLSEPWVSARCTGIMNGTLSDRMTDNGWRDRRIADKFESKYLDPEFPGYSNTRRFYGDNSQEVFASRLLTRGESELLDIRDAETCRSLFRNDRADGCGDPLGRTVNSCFTRFHEKEMDDNQWRIDRKYNNFSSVEEFCKKRTFTNDSLHKVTDENSEYIHEHPSETWVARTSAGLSKRPGTGSDYTSSIWGKEMKANSCREKRRFSSTYETYPDAESSRTLQIKHRDDFSLHRVATAGPPADHLTDCMPGHQSERSVFSNRVHSPSRHNVHYDRDSVEKFEKEKDCQDDNGWSSIQKPCNGQLKNHSVLLSHNESNQQSELNENSEEFKQRVHIAHLRFSKMLSENSNQKKQLQGQSESGSLVCIVCGRNSKKFVDAHNLALHAYDSQKTNLLAEHRGLYKALCVFLGWNQNMPPDNSRSYQSLSLAEARANKENLILWPPLVIVQNARVGLDKDGQWEGIGNPEMDELLKELGFGSGKSKALYGKEGHKGVVLVKFSSSFIGLQEAERLHKYFQGYCRGRKDWLRLQSSCTGKSDDDEDPDLVRADKETNRKRRVLYGYIGIAEDLEILDIDTRRKVSVKSREDMGKYM